MLRPALVSRRWPRAIFSAVGMMMVGVMPAPLSASVFWQGYYQSPGGPSFALAREAGGAGVWRKLGQGFDEYQLVSFDRVKEVLVVERDGVQTVLTLSESSRSYSSQSNHLKAAAQGPSLNVIVGGHTSFTVVPELKAFAQLRSRLRAVAAVAPDAEVEIVSNGEPPVAWMLTVTNACQDAGLKRITFKTVK